MPAKTRAPAKTTAKAKKKARSPAGNKTPAGKRRAGGRITGTKKDPKLAPRLTEKQENFLLKLLETDNQRLSYRAAYNCARMSDASVDTEASKLLKNPKVAQRFEALKEAARKRSSLRAVDRAARVLAELENIGFAQPSDELKMKDKIKALELLGKTEKLFTDRVDVAGADNALEVVIRTVGGDGNAG